MTLLLKGNLKQIQEAAKEGKLLWKGQKLIFDPFCSLDLVIEVEEGEEGRFSLTPYISVGGKKEQRASWEEIYPLGAIQGGIFRLWSDLHDSRWMKRLPLSWVEAQMLQTLLDEGMSVRWKGKKDRLKPVPLPILQLVDRTGGFANLLLDYGSFGKVDFHALRELNEEEELLEKDLLESGFQKKQVGDSFYFCPLDRVSKTLLFLLEVGWRVVDQKGRFLVRQERMECQVENRGDTLLLTGRVKFAEMSTSIQEVLSAFEKRERWVELSSSHIGLIDLPSSWDPFIQEEKTAEGVSLPSRHFGLLQEVNLLPADYRAAEWQESKPNPPFRGNLFPYQQKGLNWLHFLYRAGFSALLSDEMGLGKTVQVLGFLTLREGSVLIVMPVTLLSLWKQQIEQFLPGVTCYLHQGSRRAQSVEELKEQAIILTSYATLRSDALLFNQMVFDTIVLDEAQVIKNRNTQVAQTVYGLKSRFRIALTGTPIENRFEELLSIFHFLMPTIVEERSSSLDATLRRKLAPFILRRTKEEVGLDLPEKLIQMVGVEASEEERKLYEEVVQTKTIPLFAKIARDGITAYRMQVLELILRLKQLSAHPRLIDPSYGGECQKFTRTIADLEEVVLSGQKALVYSQFTSMLKIFQEMVESKGWKYVYLDGQTKDRKTPVEKFQNDPEVSLFLISLKAGGTGLNLQAANYVFLYDPWWNSAVEHQAIDRAHRIGQKNRVIARKYFTLRSIEEKILALQLQKEVVAQGIWEEKEPLEEFSFDQIQELLDY